MFEKTKGDYWWNILKIPIFSRIYSDRRARHDEPEVLTPADLNRKEVNDMMPITTDALELMVE